MKFELRYCQHCNQMTNWYKDMCMKCGKKTDVPSFIKQFMGKKVKGGGQ